MIRKLSAVILLSVSACVVSVYGQQTPVPEGSSQRSVQRVIVAALFAGGYLGVQTLEVTKENFSKYGLREVRGVAVENVVKDSPAARAGLQKGDVIARFNGEEVTSVFKLTRLISEVAPDHQAKITILRGGGESELTVTVGKREMPMFQRRGGFNSEIMPPLGAPGLPTVPILPGRNFPPMDDDNFLVFRGGEDLVFRSNGNRQIGVNVTNLTEQLGEYFGVAGGKGLLVNKVRENSPAAKAGIQAGDVIVEADGKTVENNLELLRALNDKKNGDVTLTIVRDKNRQTVTVTPEIAKDAPAAFDGFGAPNQ